MMNPTTAFLTDIGLVAFLSLGLVVYVKTHLNALLIELCGTKERASFWLAFSNVTQIFPYNFDDPERLTQTLHGASTRC
jgi:hypothetical protein